jgi:hypothetical protein
LELGCGAALRSSTGRLSRPIERKDRCLRKIS